MLHFFSEYYLPDKAIDVIDEAGVRAQLHLPQASAKVPVVTEMDILQIISSRTGIPLLELSPTESVKLMEMEETIRKKMIGQDKVGPSVEIVPD